MCRERHKKREIDIEEDKYRDREDDDKGSKREKKIDTQREGMIRVGKERR